MSKYWRVLLLACLSFAALPNIAGADEAPRGAEPRHRLIVLTDIEADPDDTQSLIRLLLYANEIDIEGLVATTSTHLRHTVHPASIHEVLAAYAEVLPNLRLHDPDYPDAEALLARVREGVAAFGMQGVGHGRDTPGTELIVRALDADDPRPLWVSVWGGANTLAQALYTLRESRSPAELAALVAKLRVYTISDQDDAGPWLRREFPELFYIVTPGDDYGMATWNAISRVIDGIDNSTISNPWLAEHIQQDHGPLGAHYPDVVWGLEGDTPAFLSLIPNGLTVPERPDWGGWGGRYESYVPDAETTLNGENHGRESRPIWTNAVDAWSPPEPARFGRATRHSAARYEDYLVTLWRWRDDFQNDFAARMDWTVKPVEASNHPPVVVLGHADSVTLEAGQGFYLSARDSFDPDGDSLSYDWFYYPEAGTYRGQLPALTNSEGAWFTAPRVEKREEVHLILRLSDKGDPPLARYARVIVTIVP
ncbi:MAG TPA: nucleoside hydrolase-like domain-containing protein [Woeseiaceae bacterium]|nr:nucleoside hydrolase-like domain-containing protein [Woeseiaceae bacterium]